MSTTIDPVALRLALGLSEEQVCAAMKVCRRTLSRYEHRERIPDAVQVLDWSAALGVPERLHDLARFWRREQ